MIPYLQKATMSHEMLYSMQSTRGYFNSREPDTTATKYIDSLPYPKRFLTLPDRYLGCYAAKDKAIFFNRLLRLLPHRKLVLNSVGALGHPSTRTLRQDNKLPIPPTRNLALLSTF